MHPRDKNWAIAKANQFLAAAGLIESSIDDSELSDAYVTLCVHAGIAAADVLCCAKLNEHSVSPNHKFAVKLLAAIDVENSVHLETLLDLKGHAGYSDLTVPEGARTNAKLAAETLVEAASLV